MKTLTSIVMLIMVCCALGCQPTANADPTVTRQSGAESDPQTETTDPPHSEELAHGSPMQRATVSAEDALEALQTGNARFVTGKSKHPHESANYRASLANEQHPFATVLACSDSRVTPVLIFDQGIGDLFVIRVAGNIVDPDVAGSIEYAVDHLGTKLLIVMGHDSCGAVTAAYHAFVAHDQEGVEPKEIVTLLKHIQPAVEAVDRDRPLPWQIAQGVEENVRLSIRSLLRIPDIAHAQKSGKVKLVGAVYSLQTGKVRLLAD